MNACNRLESVFCRGFMSNGSVFSKTSLHRSLPTASKKRKVASDSRSKRNDRTLETCVPNDRCTPEHRRQTKQPRLITAHSGLFAPQSQHVVDNASTAATRRNRAASRTPPGDEAGGGGGGVYGRSFISGDEKLRNNSPCFGRGAGDVETVRRRKGLLDEGVFTVKGTGVAIFFAALGVLVSWSAMALVIAPVHLCKSASPRACSLNGEPWALLTSKAHLAVVHVFTEDNISVATNSVSSSLF
jgi:hypothetical protein